MTRIEPLCVLPPGLPPECCTPLPKLLAAPIPIFNPPGLAAIQYRIGTFTSFRRAMLDVVASSPIPMFDVTTALADDVGPADTTISVMDPAHFPSEARYKIRIGTEYLQVAAGAGTSHWTVVRGVNNSLPGQHFQGNPVVLAIDNPFATWHEGTDGDYQTIFIELWAYLADILTFYQERIANEAFLATATQRDSLLHLVGLIDYHASPGAGASGLVAFTVQREKAFIIPAGFRTGSRVQPGRPAAVFETSSAIMAHAENNGIPISDDAPTDQFGPITSQSRQIVLKGLNNRVGSGDYVLVVEDEGAGPSKEKRTLRQITAVTSDKTANTTTITWRESPPTSYKNAVLYALRVTAGAFGNNAPAWNSLPATVTGTVSGVDGPYKGRNWDAPTQPSGNPNPWYYLPTPDASPDVLGDPPKTLFLDGIYEGAKGTLENPGWAVLLADNNVGVLHVIDARPASKAAYTITSRVTRLTFREEVPFLTFPLRTTVILTGSERLTLQERLPISAPVSGRMLRLRGQHPQLQAGQEIILQGSLFDPIANKPTDTLNAEFRILDGPPLVDTENNATIVTLKKALDKQYVRARTALLANVSEVTHGETVKDEVLGSGDGSAFQSFRLKRKPLTYLPLTDPRALDAIRGTLVVTVNGVRWDERPTLLESAPDAQEFTTILDDTGQTTVVFGDGINGARPLTGRDNIRARYRKGLGISGNVPPDAIQQLIDNIPGLQKVTNPQPSSGGTDPESLAQIRVNAPASLRTFGRAVSVADYAALALTFPGIAKASASWVLRDADYRSVLHPYVQLTVATVDHALIQQSVLAGTLRTFLDKRRDPNVPLRIGGFTRVYVDVKVEVDIDDRFPQHATLAQVTAALNPRLNPDGSAGYFAFERLEFGQSIHLSAVYAVVQAVAGVRDARIRTLRRMDLDADDPSMVREHIFIRPTEIATVGGDPTDRTKGMLTVVLGQGGFLDT